MLITNSQRVTFFYSFSEQDIVLSVVRKLGSFFIEDRVSSSTTHVITGSPRRTLNVLMAIAQGCWLVSPMWVRNYSLFFKTGVLAIISCTLDRAPVRPCIAQQVEQQ